MSTWCCSAPAWRAAGRCDGSTTSRSSTRSSCARSRGCPGTHAQWESGAHRRSATAVPRRQLP
eukprot:14542569-Alexandrium_andersonii.AAC.1